jgi:hypothetical protein
VEVVEAGDVGFRAVFLRFLCHCGCMRFSEEKYCGVWPIKCRQGSKTNKLNCQFWMKSTYDWLCREFIWPGTIVCTG